MSGGYVWAWVKHFFRRHPMARAYWREDYWESICPHPSSEISDGMCGWCGAAWFSGEGWFTASSNTTIELDCSWPTPLREDTER